MTLKRILIANRGEVARRIMRTCRKMGIESVAVFSADDADAPFVAEADLAVPLEGKRVADTYLSVEQMLAAARTTGSDAVHPGYGFLSENADFARATVAAGVTWIGPGADVIGLMGDKLKAKALLTDAGIPMLQATTLDSGGEVTVDQVQQLDFPVLVKAAAGGGGRGMRVVTSFEALNDAIAGARREAGAAFGDDTVFIERWVNAARHIEVQLLGDSHGNLVHLFERECSIQRRHQKVIEEAPSVTLNDDRRQALFDAALTIGRVLGYESAGTVEFLVGEQGFWFLEVNTRLQVEHPVTEAITGLDIVAEQIRIAAGEPLSVRQSDLAISGHAVEARLYAENPAKNFFPSPGTLHVWQPYEAAGARFDSGVEKGTVIGTSFDPMIAKVVTHGTTRQDAIDRLCKTLTATRIQGVTSNRDFLVNVLQTEEFIRGDTTTDFINRVNPARSRHITLREVLCAAVGVHHIASAGDGTFTLQCGRDKWTVQLARDGEHRCVASTDGETLAARVAMVGDHQVRLGGNEVDMVLEIVRAGDLWLVHGPLGDLDLKLRSAG